MAFADLLNQFLTAFGVSLPEERVDALARHFALVLEANARLNLTAIVDPRDAALKHYCDSLALLRVMDDWPAPGQAADVGSGAGFPGIPLAIARPQWRWALIESKRKKAEFLQDAVGRLRLDNVEIALGRSEELARRPPWRDGFDLVVGRAIAPLGAVAELLLPLARPGGLAVAMKGAEQSLSPEAGEALARLGGGAPSLQAHELPGGAGRRTLALLPKIAPTPPDFPRRPGMAGKRPLF
ncbi:MAG: 16S rRNA (guanine(527)-N(7))-methyltransferase RsmG [Candidatus Sumerlaeota bacterium]|nr:16S rRNA (guanine(527)-N(7))-methyltransferase RsmG [Candidatus Sumerlaeota bacterium]